MMAKIVGRIFLLFAAGSVVSVISTPMRARRSLTCEDKLQAVHVDPLLCERIRSAVLSVRQAVVDIDAKVKRRTLAYSVIIMTRPFARKDCHIKVTGRQFYSVIKMKYVFTLSTLIQTFKW